MPDMSVSPEMRRRVVVSSTIGNALEWFDFTVFGLFAVVIARHFFPAADATSSLLKTFATFGIAFAARPLGGIAFGVYADRHGRKRALVVMITMMAIGTGLIGIMPTYAAIGVLAPLGVLLARLIQGASAGGEFGSASAMLIEFAPPGQRGLYGSSQTVSQSIAFTLGAGAAYLLNSQLSAEDFSAWGWRVPFLLGVLIGPVGFFMRHKVDESPEFKARPRTVSSPLAEVVNKYPRQLAVGFCLTAAGTAITYVTSVFLPAYAASRLGFRLSDAQLGLIVASLGSAILAVVSGHLSDRFGRRAVIGPALLAFCLLFYGQFSNLLAHPTLTNLWMLQGLGMVLGFMVGPMPALMTEIFPVGVRSTGASLVYNLAVMCFGGLSPFFITALSQYHPLAPAYYLVMAAAIGGLGLLLHRPDEVGFTPS